MTSDVTARQREAVTHHASPLLVLGGAGTGKTRVLVDRFAWLVEQGTSPEDILALTFSAAFLGESLHPRELLGAALIVAGTIVIAWR